MAGFERRDRASGIVWAQVIAGVFAVPVLHLLMGLALWGLWAGFRYGFEAGTVSRETFTSVALLAAGWLGTLGVSQLLYVGPVAAVALVLDRLRGVGIGMLIGMALTLVLQGACYGLFFASYVQW